MQTVHREASGNDVVRVYEQDVGKEFFAFLTAWLRYEPHYDGSHTLDLEVLNKAKAEYDRAVAIREMTLDGIYRRRSKPVKVLEFEIHLINNGVCHSVRAVSPSAVQQAMSNLDWRGCMKHTAIESLRDAIGPMIADDFEVLGIRPYYSWVDKEDYDSQ